MTLVTPQRRLFLNLLLGFLVLFASACEEVPGSSALSQGDFEQVDPLFREFYEHLDGLSLLGPAISPAFQAGGLTYQYTSASLMVYDPLGPASQRFSLAPLGLDLGIAEPAVPAPTQAGLRYIDGHILYEGFILPYERLGGARFIGRPITELHYSPDLRRYEQHFENIGLYLLEGDPPGAIHAMSYGAWKCSASCRQVTPGNAMLILPPRVGDPFVQTVSWLGPDFTGFALSEAYPVDAGRMMQIFENLVLVTDPANPGQGILQPVTEQLGILPDPLVAPSSDTQFYFYPLQDGLGHNVPQRFIDFLALHGGIAVSGPPLTELNRMNEGVFRQCFTNLCLEEHYGASGAVWIRLSPLGYSYRSAGAAWSAPAPTQVAAAPVEAVPTSAPIVEPPVIPTPLPESLPTPAPELQPTAVVEPPAASPASPSYQALTLQVWAANPLVASGAAQEIGVGVFDNTQPVSMVEPDLVVTHPDGTTQTYYMYPTGDDGLTRQPIDPITAPNGSVIPYQVCIFSPSGEQYCVRDSFLIWDNP